MITYHIQSILGLTLLENAIKTTYLHKEEGLGLFDIFSKNLIKCGADSILLACTEFGIPYLEGEVDIFDSSKIYAEDVVRFARGCWNQKLYILHTTYYHYYDKL